MPRTIELTRRIPRWARPLQRPCRYKGTSGGRGSGKSHYFAEEAVEAMVCDPSIRIVCIREVQRSLEFSAKSLIEHKIRELGVSALFDVRTTKIMSRIGPGVMIFEGMQEHTADSIKSLEGFRIAWVEEAQNISQRSLDLLLPTIRTEGSEIWFSWNPEKASDPVDVLFSTSAGDGFARVHTTFRDNPFLTTVLRTEAKRLQASDPEAFAHVWEGGYDLGKRGRVYAKFVNRLFPDGNLDASVIDHGGELYIGQDFNVHPMASVIAIRVVDECHVLDALQIGTSNTSEVADELRRRYPNRRIIMCPDPAGNARHTNAPVGQTDFTILRAAGFEVRAPRAHPLIVDRVNNTNAMMDADGRRRVRIHPRATALTHALANLTYKPDTSIPDKSSGLDHACFDGDTLVETPDGVVPIASLPWSGTVRGPLGQWVPYIAAQRTRKNADVLRLTFESGYAVVCTPDHRWLTSRGWIRAMDFAQTTGYIALCDTESLATRYRNLTASPITGAGITSSALGNDCIAWSVPPCTGQFPTGLPCTISTEMPPTIHRKTWLSSNGRRITANICANQSASRMRSERFEPHSEQRQNGTAARRGVRGTESITPVMGPRCISSMTPRVTNADERTKRTGDVLRHTARATAKRHIDGFTSSTMRPALARIATANFDAIDSCPRRTVASGAVRSHEKIVSVVSVSPRDVYDLCVPGVGSFALASGLVVSNCDALGYLLWQEFNLLQRRSSSISSFAIG